MHRRKSYWPALLGIIAIQVEITAAWCQVKEPPRVELGLSVGQALPLSGTSYVIGLRADAKQFPACPAYFPANSPKLGVYARAANEPLFRLASRLEALIDKAPALKWSYVEVIAPEGAKAASAEARTKRNEVLTAMREQSEAAGIKQLTIALSARAGHEAAEHLGMPESADLMLVYSGRRQMFRVGKEEHKMTCPPVLFSKPLKWKDLTPERIEALLDEVARLNEVQEPAEKP